MYNINIYIYIRYRIRGLIEIIQNNIYKYSILYSIRRLKYTEMQMPLLHIITYMNIDIAFKKNIDIHEQKNICKTSNHSIFGFITIQTIMFLTFSYLK